MKIPFDIKYRPEIESGKYKVQTRDGHSVRIVCWDALGEYPILALIKIDNDKESCNRFTNSGAFMVDNEVNPLDIIIVTDDEGLTEFEKALSDGIDYWIHEELKEPTIESVKKLAQSLLGIAKKELKKDLPKWKYMSNGGCGGGDRDCFLIRCCEGQYYTSTCIGPDTTYLELDELEKLPKEE